MKKCSIVFILLLLCTGCWDLKEINQLAIVNVVGTDKDPDTGTYTGYYQVVNPTGISNRQGGGSQASVYTFHFKEYSFGRFTARTSTAMPRLLFTAHMQCYIISERYARDGVLDLINFLELNPERRTNLLFLVSDSPISTVMHTFTPLERSPGRFVRSLLDLHVRSAQTQIAPIRLKDLIKGLPLHQPTVIPIVHYNGQQPASNTNEVEEINAIENGLSFTDGAVFIHGRMAGRIAMKMKQVNAILNNKINAFTETMKVNGSYVDVTAHNLRVKREWDRSASRLTLKIYANLRITNNQQKSRTTVHNLHEVEKAFNRRVTQRAESLIQLGLKKDWDLLGIQDERPNIDSWRQVKIAFQVSSKVTTTGNTSTPYN
ncbi:Ger(x)C family spore germination C-terminal domain-containing protein [Cohnella sp.]|uniref:Ger(x)C family spore germination protein n=1 Tax=Cohnella sp. TaxID=1883426 RepID=UPI00356418A6